MLKLLQIICIVALICSSCAHKATTEDGKSSESSPNKEQFDTAGRVNIVDSVKLSRTQNTSRDLLPPLYDLDTIQPGIEQTIYFPLMNIDSIDANVTELTTSIEGVVPDISRKNIKSDMTVCVSLAFTTPTTPGPWEWDLMIHTQEAVKPFVFKVKGVIK